MSLPKPVPALLLGTALLAGSAQAQNEPPPADPVLRQLLEEALQRNPQLLAARETVRAAEARPVQAGRRPGPTVGVFYQNDGVAPSLGREPMTMLGLSGGQEIPYPGKRTLRGAVAEADAGLAGLEAERVRLSLIASVKRAYYGLLLARALADVAQEHREVWQDVQQTARARQAAAVGSQQEMLRAQIETTRLHALHAQHHAEARARLAALNALAGRPVDTPLETTARLLPPASDRSPDEWVAWSEAASPELKAAAALVEREERAMALARLESRPDFSVQGGVAYRGSLPPMWQLSGSVLLPSRTAARAAVAEAEARLSAGKARLADVRVRLRAAVEQRLALVDAAEQIEVTYREGLLPQAEAAVQSATARYAAGQGPQLGVLEGLLSLFEDRVDYLRLLATHATEQARLEEASLEPPADADSLLMHGRSSGGGGGSMAPPSAGDTVAEKR